MQDGHLAHVVCVTDFPDASGQLHRLRFSQPRELVVARRACDVPQALHAIDQATRDGAWAVGCMAYEAAAGLDSKNAKSMGIDPERDHPQPLLIFGIFEGPDAPPDPAGEPVRPDTDTPAPCPPHATCPAPAWVLSETAGHHAQAIARIRQAIAAGDVYQVNHTLRVNAPPPAPADGFSLWHYHEALRARQQARYCAWLDWGDWQVLSLSPELFFEWNRATGQITTRPMKGTSERGKNPEEDFFLAEQLKKNQKERAENVMIVDLLRNDLGRVAVTGSVQVPRLFETEPYPTLWQMTSTVQAITRPETDLTSLMQALFPCGSITGAPKQMAMQYIAALEDSPRGVYCGTVGIISPYRAMFNVAIRTLATSAQGMMQAGVGSGITWSSQPAPEYAETGLKARFLQTPPLPAPGFDLLETLLLTNGQYALLPQHLARMAASEQFWSFRPRTTRQREICLQAFASQHPQGMWRVRLLQSPQGLLRTEGTAIPPTADTTPARWDSTWHAPSEWLHTPEREQIHSLHEIEIAETPFSADMLPWLQHKTTCRQHYGQFTRQHPDAWDVLLHNEQGFATECTRGNIVLHADGQWLTPPWKHGLLAGTLREVLLRQGVIREAPIPLQRLQHPRPGDSLWFINGVRGWLKLALPPVPEAPAGTAT